MHFDVRADVDPLADVVKVALVERGKTPIDADFLTAEWVPGQVWAAGVDVRARRLVAKGTLVRGEIYRVWVQVTDSPEVPEMLCGTVLGV